MGELEKLAAKAVDGARCLERHSDEISGKTSEVSTRAGKKILVQ